MAPIQEYLPREPKGLHRNRKFSHACRQKGDQPPQAPVESSRWRVATPIERSANPCLRVESPLFLPKNASNVFAWSCYALCKRETDARSKPLLEDIPAGDRATALLRLLKVELEFEWNQRRGTDQDHYIDRFSEMKEVVLEAFAWVREELLTQANHSTAREREGVESFDVAENVAMPRKIGRFEIIDIIGEGGFGRVFRAHAPNLDRLVALKAASNKRKGSGLGDTALLEEARASASLRHPGIVQVYELAIEHDPPFIVQELIEGVEPRFCFDVSRHCEWSLQLRLA